MYLFLVPIFMLFRLINQLCIYGMIAIKYSKLKLASVGVCWHVMFAGDALGVSGGCLGGVWGHLEWYSFISEVFGCVWGLSGFSVLAVWSQNTNLTKS